MSAEDFAKEAAAREGSALTVGVVGLGLIGGSLAKAYTAAGHRVLGYDLNGSVTGIAMLQGAISGELSPDMLRECDLVLLATFPSAVVSYLRDMAELFGNAVVVDCGGVKREICREGFALAKKHGFLFVGGHPMAGSHRGGFSNSRANLFNGASMIIVPPTLDDITLLDRMRGLLMPAGFGRITATTADKHDRMIAFTSQLAHVVSNAYVKSPEALEHRGYSAGSYRDLTRVAYLDPDMWTELFLDNADNLTSELDFLIDSLKSYRNAIAAGDADTLRALLDDGKRIKEATMKNGKGNG